MAVQINFDFREKIRSAIEGNLLSFCYQCGACVGDCPSARFDEDFNPRKIMLEALYGLESRLISRESAIWNCSNCYTCYERCPQRVKPVEVILALKNLATRAGEAPRAIEPQVARCKATGRSATITPKTITIRTELGLPPLPEIPVDELEEILKP